jgi:Protein of unknown function (DUF3626)
MAQPLHLGTTCTTRGLLGNNDNAQTNLLGPLTPYQKLALSTVRPAAQAFYYATMPLLTQRVESLGFSYYQLQNCLDFIRDEAPITIHMDENTLAKLVQDTNYRNCFEVGGSAANRSADMLWYCAKRYYWESRMFRGSYEFALHCDRPKYGCLNFTGDISGATSCYGTMHLILSQNVRSRATHFYQDSGNYIHYYPNCPIVLGTSEYYAHILQGYNEIDLVAALNVANHSRIRGAPSTSRQGVGYKEVQIHGPVNLASDIQALSLPGKEQHASTWLLAHVEGF